MRYMVSRISLIVLEYCMIWYVTFCVAAVFGLCAEGFVPHES